MMGPVLVAMLLATLTTVSTQQSNTTTSSSNMTTVDSNLTTSTPPTTKAPTGNASANTTSITTTTSKTTTVSPPLGKLRPVSDRCLTQYLSCVENTADYIAGNFCQASTVNMKCINDTVNCTTADVGRITYVDCGPNILGANKKVEIRCQARITECLSLSDKPENIKPATDFKTFFCAKKDDKCLTTQSAATAKNVCKADEIEAAVKVAGCTAAQTVISSTLFISLALLTQWILNRY